MLVVFRGVHKMSITPQQYDRVIKYLDIVRSEFRQRIELKQQVLTTYVIGLAAIFGFVIQGFHSNPLIINILWLIPFISLSAAAFFGDHMLISIALSQYIENNLEWLLNEDGLTIPFWDRNSAIDPAASIFDILNVIEAAIICLPTCAAIFILLWPSHRVYWMGRSFEVLLTIYAVACLCISVWLVTKMAREARDTFRSTKGKKQKNSPHPEGEGELSTKQDRNVVSVRPLR